VKQLSFADAPRKARTRLHVLPDAARVEERLLQLSRQHGFVAGRVACSVADLERDLVRAVQREGRCGPVASPQAVLLALREAARDHSAGPYAKVAEQRGYVRALGELLATLGQAVVSPDELRDVPERVAALARTLAAALRTLDRAGLAEPHRALRIALESVALPLPDEVVLEDLVDWSPLRLRLAAALAARTRVKVRLPWSRPELNTALEPALRFFESLGSGPELELFEPAEPPAPALFSCASPAAEARLVARRCAGLLALGAAPDSIAIAARTLAGGVAEELAAALDRCGIRWRERRGRPALQAPAVRMLLSLPELAADDFPREAVIALLSSRLLWMREQGERLPPQALARRLRQAHVRDDASDGGYAGRLAALERRLRLNGEAADDLAEVAARVQRLLSQLRSLPAAATLAGHVTALQELASRWGLPQRLRAVEALPQAAAALARDQTAARSFDDACAELVKGAAAVGLAGARMSQTAFADLLAESLASVSLPGGGARGAAVQLVELRELAGRSFDHVIVTGLIDGVLPARPPIDPLLSDDERRAVNRALKRLVFRDKTPEEPLAFQLALAAARSSAALTWPRGDAQGRELLRSSFIDDLEREPEAVPLAAIPAAADCAGAPDLLARAALDAFADPAFRVTPPADPVEARRLAGAVAASTLRDRFRRVARAAQAERERVRVFIGEIAPGRFSGQLSGEALELARAKFAFGPDAPASARQLEDHALCGFRTLGRRLLHLSQDDQDDVELGHKERGQLLHRCLERYYREGGDLRALAGEEMDAFAAREYVGHRALWELRRERIVEELFAVVEAEEGLSPNPLALEQRFGFDEPDSWPALRVGGVHVRGIIDRLDRQGDGSLLVIDYKSASIKSLTPRLKEAPSPEFQLPLYVAAVQQEKPGPAVGAVYLSLKHAQRTKPLPDVQALLAPAVEERAAKMRAGTFPVRPLTCDWCELTPLCRLVALPVDPDENGGVRSA